MNALLYLRDSRKKSKNTDLLISTIYEFLRNQPNPAIKNLFIIHLKFSTCCFKKCCFINYCFSVKKYKNH